MFLDAVSEIVPYKDNAELIEAFEKTKKFDIGKQEESFYTFGQIDLSSILKNYQDFLDLTTENDIYDFILDAPSFRYLAYSYNYKTYMFLNEIFKELEEKTRSEKLFDIPLHIYYCDSGACISIYIIE